MNLIKWFGGIVIVLGLLGYTPDQDFNSYEEGLPKSCPCIIQSDSLALVDFYQKANGPNWINQWDFSKPIKDWYGVKLNSSGCVRCLDLDGDPSCGWKRVKGNNVQGQLPDLKLPHLEHLFLGQNQLKDTIPNFTHLRYLLTLQLSNNQLTGVIPPFEKLNNIVSLELEFNQLEGNIPNFKKSPKLTNLYLNYNKLSGKIPEFSHTPKLKRVYASRNLLEGSLPYFENTPELTSISFAQNRLTGQIPKLRHLKSLSHLNLSSNSFEGALPSFKKMKALRQVNFSNNKLTGEISSFKNSDLLESILLSNNNFTSCPKLSGKPKLNYILLNGNQLDFQQLDKNRSLLGGPETYAYQRWNTKDSLIYLSSGDSIIIDLGKEKSSNNQYTWFLDGVELDAPNEPFIEIKEIEAEQSGKYKCEITNRHYPDMVLRTANFNIKLEDIIDIDELVKITPIAQDDQFIFNTSSTTFRLNVIENDILSGLEDWEINILKEPETGIMYNLEDGEIKYNIPPGFYGVVSFEYQLLNIFNPEKSTTAKVDIHIDPSDDMVQQIPNAISPNGDGVNDNFIVPALEDNPDLRSEIIIFNRFGHTVFTASPYQNNWNGILQSNGSALPEGTYFYSLKIEGEPKDFTGFIEVKR